VVLGGVVSFYLGWQWPEVFGKIACLSSIFSHRDNSLDRVSTEPKGKSGFTLIAAGRLTITKARDGIRVFDEVG
jgi:enterochelin esterase-like enzyme